jgi:co-chaperonin GroES (HSP10)
VRVLNFYSSVFADQLRRGRKTATIRLGDKSHKYRKNECVLVTIGYQHSPREKIFYAVIDQVEVKRVRDLSPRDIEHDNPEFRRIDEMVHFLEQIYGRKVSLEDTVTVVRFSQIIENPPELRDRIRGLGGASYSPCGWHSQSMSASGTESPNPSIRRFHQMKLKPLGDRLIVRAIEEEEQTASGIVLPDTAKEKPQKGKVLAVGDGRVNEDTGKRTPLDVAEGDEVLYSKYGGTEIKVDGEELLVLRESDVLAKVQ